MSAQNAQAEGYSRVQMGAYGNIRKILVTQDADYHMTKQKLHLVLPDTPRDTNTPNVTPSEKPKLIDRYWPFFSWLVVTWATEPHPKSCNGARWGAGSVHRAKIVPLRTTGGVQVPSPCPWFFFVTRIVKINGPGWLEIN